MSTVSIAAVILAILALLFVSRSRSQARNHRMCILFGLDPSEYDLLGSDLGGGRDKVYLRANGVVGVPDAVFRHRRTRHIVVGEAKKRRVGRNGVTKYERFQVILYIGAAESKYRKNVSAIIHYGCGTLIPIDSDRATYRRLIGLIPEYRKVAKRIGMHPGGNAPRRRAAV